LRRIVSLSLAVALAGAAVAAVAPRAAAQQLAVDRHTLANGMVVLTHEDHSIPMISFYVFYRVGARNERPGITGVSHLFEHMMFNGSGKFKPKEFDRLLETAGSGGNGYTTEDFTAYLETFPREALPLVLDLESDRMLSLSVTPQNLEQERGIVKEERRVSVDNDPASRLYEEMYAAAYVAHPYGWPVVGWMGDLDAIKLEEAQRYFDNYYGPNNATLVLAGDFKTADLMKQVESYFGKLPKRGTIPPVVNSEPEQQGERRVALVKEASLPAIFVGYKAVEARHADVPALEVLESILGQGESSRLFQKLVYAQIATAAQAGFQPKLDPSLFTFYIQAQQGKTAAECERALYDVLRDVRANGVTAQELQKAKNQLRADLVRNLMTTGSKANLLGVYETLYGDYRALFAALEKFDAVTSDDVKRVANEYLAKRRRTVVTLAIPQGGKEATDEQE
jgi:zinc protease